MASINMRIPVHPVGWSRFSNFYQHAKTYKHPAKLGVL